MEEASGTWVLTRLSLLWENTRQGALKKGGLVFLSPFEGTVHHGVVVRAALAVVAGVWGSWIHHQKVGGDRETERTDVGAQLAFCFFILIQSRLPVHGMVPHSRWLSPPQLNLSKSTLIHTHLEVHFLGGSRLSPADHEDGPSSCLLVIGQPCHTQPSMAYGFCKLLTSLMHMSFETADYKRIWIWECWPLSSRSTQLMRGEEHYSTDIYWVSRRHLGD